MRKIIYKLIVIILIFAILTTACVPIRPMPEQVTLSFWDTIGGQGFEVMQEIINDIEDQLVNVQIEHIYVPLSEARKQFIDAAAGTAPDLINLPAEWVPDLAAKNLLYEITEKLSSQDRDDYLPPVLDFNVFPPGEDAIWGIPQTVDVLTLFYNKRLFAESGLAGEPPQTMEDFVNYAQVLTKDDTQYGFELSGGLYFFLPFMWAFGGSFVDEETGEFAVDSPQMVEALDFVVALHGVTPGTYDPNEQYHIAMENFKAGKVAMMFNGPGAISDVLSSAEFADPDNLGIALIPAGPEGKRGSPVGGRSYLIAANTRHPDEAYQVIDALNQPDKQALLANKLFLLPSRNSTYQLPELRENQVAQNFLQQVQLSSVKSMVLHQILLSEDQEFQQAYGAVLLGQSDTSEALTGVAEAWQAKFAGLWFCCYFKIKCC